LAQVCGLTNGMALILAKLAHAINLGMSLVA